MNLGVWSDETGREWEEQRTPRSRVCSEQWTLQPSYAWIKDQIRALKRSINFNVVESEVFIDILSYSTKKIKHGADRRRRIYSLEPNARDVKNGNQ